MTPVNSVSLQANRTAPSKGPFLFYKPPPPQKAHGGVAGQPFRRLGKHPTPNQSEFASGGSLHLTQQFFKLGMLPCAQKLDRVSAVVLE